VDAKTGQTKESNEVFLLVENNTGRQFLNQTYKDEN